MYIQNNPSVLFAARARNTTTKRGRKDVNCLSPFLKGLYDVYLAKKNEENELSKGSSYSRPNDPADFENRLTVKWHGWRDNHAYPSEVLCAVAATKPYPEQAQHVDYLLKKEGADPNTLCYLYFPPPWLCQEKGEGKPVFGKHDAIGLALGTGNDALFAKLLPHINVQNLIAWMAYRCKPDEIKRFLPLVPKDLVTNRADSIFMNTVMQDVKNKPAEAQDRLEVIRMVLPHVTPYAKGEALIRAWAWGHPEETLNTIARQTDLTGFTAAVSHCHRLQDLVFIYHLAKRTQPGLLKDLAQGMNARIAKLEEEGRITEKDKQRSKTFFPELAEDSILYYEI